ncbi:NYN domain-containing protein [Thermomonas sp.]|jgi:hypothetical protein|uniref:NYN domain-containing protein n=1 Tax=Thermomonas sp. TaxID=1971895 RepID=UPI001AD454A0|nr:NYN domain-containing protein [Xanthomonadales bacterium]MBN8768573.1 NYN domain-containing protein [Stenotrophomonas sp.]
MDAIAYVDGFNLYYGALKGTKAKWLDLQALAIALAPKPLVVRKIRYFTAKVKPAPRSPSAHMDQQAYLDALRAHCPLIEIHYGDFLRHKVRMESANPPPATVEVFKTEEKGSDVNLAVHLLNDAWAGQAQAAILISNDSDLAEAVRLAQAQGMPVYWFPPTLNNGRYPSVELKKVTAFQRGMYPNVLGRCQLPNPVGNISKPTGW